MGLIVTDWKLQAGLDGPFENYCMVFCDCVVIPVLCDLLLSIHTGFLVCNFTAYS